MQGSLAGSAPDAARPESVHFSRDNETRTRLIATAAAGFGNWYALSQQLPPAPIAFPGSLSTSAPWPAPQKAVQVLWGAKKTAMLELVRPVGTELPRAAGRAVCFKSSRDRVRWPTGHPLSSLRSSSRHT